jgi:hypothetical protein
MARGYCAKCYENVHYSENKETEHRKRKAARLAKPEEWHEAKYQREKAWKQANRDRALASQSAHYERNKHLLNKWPVGATVWVLFAGVWCEGKISGRINRLKIEVVLKGGTRLETGIRSKKDIRREKPEELDVRPAAAPVADRNRTAADGPWWRDLLRPETRAKLEARRPA